MVSLAPLEIEITADTAKAEAGLNRLQGELKDTGGAAQTAGAKTASAAGQIGRVAPAATKANPALRNMSMQLSQVAQQGAVTGNYLQALIVQVPDLALGFGALGIVAGALVPIVYGVAQGFLAADGDGRTLDETLESLGSSVSALTSLSDASNQSWQSLTETFGNNASAARENIELLTQLAGITAMSELKATTLALSEELGSVVSRFVVLGDTGGHQGRVVTQRFEALRGELKLSEGQLIRLGGLFDGLGAAETLDEATGAAQSLTDFLEQVYGHADNIPPALREAAQAAAEAANAGHRIKEALGVAGTEAYNVRDAVNAITSATSAAIGEANGLTTAWGNVATNAWEAAKAMAASEMRMGMDETGVADLANQYAAYGQGRQSFDQRAQAGLGDITGGVARPATVSASAGGGGGSCGSGGATTVNPIIAELEAVQQALMSAEEAQIASYEMQQETLQAALEQRLLTTQEYNALLEEAQKQHADAMTAIDAYKHGNMLDQTEAFFGDAASALASGNSKMAAISQKFAAIEATINAGRAFAQVAADPSLPWYAKIPAALGVASAISSFSSSTGIGGGAAAAASAVSDVSQQVSKSVNIVIEGATGPAKSLAEQLSDELADGYQIAGLTVK